MIDPIGPANSGVATVEAIAAHNRKYKVTFFNQSSAKNFSSLSVSESYKILNLAEGKKYTKEEINKAYQKIQKRIHPDVSPETSRLSSIVNEARDVLLNEIK